MGTIPFHKKNPNRGFVHHIDTGQDSRALRGTNVYAPNTLPTTVQYDRVLPSILLLLLFIKRHVLPVIRNQPLRRLAIQGPTNFLCPLHGLLYLLLGSSLFPPGTFLLLIPRTRLAILEAAHWIRRALKHPCRTRNLFSTSPPLPHCL